MNQYIFVILAVLAAGTVIVQAYLMGSRTDARVIALIGSIVLFIILVTVSLQLK